MLWVNADLSSLEDKTKQCCIIDLDPDYVSQLNVPGYDAHLAIGLRAGFFDQEDVDFFRYMKKLSDGKDPGELPTKYIGREEEFELLYGKMQDDRQKAKTVNYSCQLLNTDIVTSTWGTKELRDIKVGDIVIGQNNRGESEETEVFSVVEPYLDDVYYIHIEGGILLHSTLGHRWKLRNGTYKRLEDLIEGDELNLGPLYKKPIFLSKEFWKNDYVSCITTGLGNYFHKVEGKVTLTGNCTYGAGPAKIADSAECSLSEAKTLHTTYWDLNWSVKHFAESCTTKEYEGSKYIWSPFTKMWLKFNAEHMRFSAVNQNFGATVFDVWCYFLSERGVKIIMSIHDESSWYIPDTEEAIEKAKQDVKWSIDQTNRIFNQPITFEAEPEFAKSYGDVH